MRRFSYSERSKSYAGTKIEISVICSKLNLADAGLGLMLVLACHVRL